MADLTSYSDDTTVCLSGPAADIEDADQSEDDGGDLEDLERALRCGRRRRGARRVR
jgi:hypothetical protein